MSAKILLFDLETSPLLVYSWGLGDQNITLDQLHTDWSILSWSAKWLDKDNVMYRDTRNEKNIRNDKKILKPLWNLLDECDVVITQNGKNFDAKKVNTRFIKHGMRPPSSYKHIDTLQISRKVFGFTSNKLAYTTGHLCKTKKSEHKKFPGLELWKECLAGNTSAWNEMEKYNKQDVLSLEELYKRLSPWDQSVNFALYNDNPIQKCNCGSESFRRNGFHFTPSGKFQRYRCNGCGAEGRHSKNLFNKEKRESLIRIKT